MYCAGKELAMLLFVGVIRLYLMSLSSVIFPFPSGSSCSKLTTLLVNDLLKFQMAILQIHYYFLLIKCENAKDSHAMQRILTFYQQK